MISTLTESAPSKRRDVKLDAPPSWLPEIHTGTDYTKSFRLLKHVPLAVFFQSDAPSESNAVAGPYASTELSQLANLVSDMLYAGSPFVIAPMTRSGVGAYRTSQWGESYLYWKEGQKAKGRAK